MHWIGLVPVQTPAWHMSVCVQALPSLHATPVRSVHVPSAAPPAAIEQASHGPAPHAALQQTPSAQKPLWQLAPVAHAMPLRLPPKTCALAVAPRVVPPPRTSTLPFGSVVLAKPISTDMVP